MCGPTGHPGTPALHSQSGPWDEGEETFDPWPDMSARSPTVQASSWGKGRVKLHLFQRPDTLNILQRKNGGSGGQIHFEKHISIVKALMLPLWKTEWRCLNKLKIELPYDPAITLLVFI